MICKNCGKMVLPENGHIIDSEFYCNECAVECVDCGDYILKDNAIKTHDGDFICEYCYDNDYFTCEDCGRAVSDDDYYYNEYDGCNYCPNCYNNQSDSIYSYHGYSDFYKYKREDEIDPVEYLGLEIEVSGDNAYADTFLAKVSNVVLMHDSSIEDGGFEIVSEPMTRRYIEELFLPMLEKGMNYLNDNEFRGHNHGGIHIHVSQEVFTKKMLCVLRNILYSGDDEDFDIWKAISQRHTSEIKQWCKFIEGKICSEILYSEKDYPALSDNILSKY